MTQNRLDSYGAPQNKPVLITDCKVQPINTESRGVMQPGYRGHIPYRNTYGFVRFCDHDDHYNPDVDGSILRVKVKEHLESRGVHTILFAEEDTGTVYEYNISQFKERVPKTAKGSDAKEEPQYYTPIDFHYARFDDHVDDVLATDREDADT